MCVWQESCRRYRVAVKSCGIPQTECVCCLLQPPSLPAPNVPGVVEEDALCAGWRLAGHPGACGWLGGIEDADSGRLHFHETGPGTVPPLTLRPLKPRAYSAPVERELCALGPELWGRQHLCPCGTRQGRQAAACLAISQGQVTQPGSKPTSNVGAHQRCSTPLLLAVFHELQGAWVRRAAPKSPWWATSPCIPLCPAPLGSKSPCGAKETCERRCCPCPAAGSGEEKASEA